MVMKFFKKVLRICFTIALLFSFLNLSADYVASICDWDMDQDIHWLTSVNGKKIAMGSHDLEANVCSVCSAEIINFDEGEVWVCKNNEHGDIEKWICFDPEGKITLDSRFEYKYAEDGTMVSKSLYEFSAHVSDVEYSSDIHGDRYEAKQTLYNEDGSKSVMLFNEFGDALSTTYFDKAGFLVSK